jgi:malonate decarboxylase beta subunit
VLAADAVIDGEMARLLCVVADASSPYPRARHGEVGVREALDLADAVRAVIAGGRQEEEGRQRPVVAIVDVPSQAYGRLEETVGLHLALAAAVDAYAAARRRGHPVIALVVGSAISGGFLAHGLLANQIVALDAPGVEVQAMRRQAAARITRRSEEELGRLGRVVVPLSYDIREWATLGYCDELVAVHDPDAPTPDDVDVVRRALAAAIARARRGPRNLANRLDSPQAATSRAASLRARAAIRDQWE